MNFVCVVFELCDKMLTLSSMENLIVPCNRVYVAHAANVFEANTWFWCVNVKKYIRIGITIFQYVILGCISSDIRSEIIILAPLTRRRKTNFPTVYPTIYLPKWQIWIQLSPKWPRILWDGDIIWEDIVAVETTMNGAWSMTTPILIPPI